MDSYFSSGILERMQEFRPAVLSQFLGGKVDKVEAATEQQDLLLRETQRGAHQAAAAAVDSLFLPQSGGGSLIMDYLLLENLDLLIFTPAGFHPLYYLKAKNLISTFSLSGVL